MIDVLSLLLPLTIGKSPQAGGEDTVPPPIPRELRAVWVATVANIDWPSRRGLSSERQRAEMLAILDRCVELNLKWQFWSLSIDIWDLFVIWSLRFGI